MAVNGISGNIIPRDDVFIDYLWYRTCQVNNHPITKTPERDELNKKLQHLAFTDLAKKHMQETDVRNKSDLNIQRWIDTITIEFKRNCFQRNDFQWLEDNKRQTCYIWRLLSHLTWEEYRSGNSNEHTLNHSIPINFDERSVKCHIGMQHIDNHTVSKLDIIHFINRLNSDKSEKNIFVEYIRSTSNEALKNKEMTIWFANDKKLKTKWLSEYLTSNQSGYTQLTMPSSVSRMNDLISFFDMLYILNEDRYKWMIINIRKAWNQRTYRERNKTKKQYSINMSDDIGKILDELSLDKRENKNAIVEALIRAEYDKITRP
ncbi:hypothetical protein [Aeromonas enteropelogenes]|uniref:hypothetical protein n=1 Tax=Aeromonas enteropelogenes TaxID=29489 RepID=UPI003BA25311